MAAFDTSQGNAVGAFGPDGILQNLFAADVTAFAIDVALTTTLQDESLVTWFDGVPERPIQVQRFSIAGQPVGAPIVVDDVADEFPHDPRVAAAADGSYVVVWWAELAHAMWARWYDSSDRPLGERVPVVEPCELEDSLWRTVCVDQRSGSALVAWQEEGSDVQFRRLTAGGPADALAVCAGIGGLPYLACAGEDRFVVAGATGNDLGTQLFVALRAFDARNRVIGNAVIELPADIRGLLIDSVAISTEDIVMAVWPQCPSNVSEQAQAEDCDVFARRYRLTDQPDCTGDCNADGEVSVDELVLAVDIALTDRAGAGRCATIDTDADCEVSLGELVNAVDRSLNGCQQ